MNKNFESAIEERNSKNIKSELTFIGIKSSTIEKFEKTAEATFFLREIYKRNYILLKR